MEREWLIITGWIFNLFIGIVAWLLKSQYGGIVKRVEHLEEHMDEIRDNYLDRFDEIKDILAEIRVEQEKIKGCVTKIQSICTLQHSPLTKPREGS